MMISMEALFVTGRIPTVVVYTETTERKWCKRGEDSGSTLGEHNTNTHQAFFVIHVLDTNAMELQTAVQCIPGEWALKSAKILVVASAYPRNWKR